MEASTGFESSDAATRAMGAGGTATMDAAKTAVDAKALDGASLAARLASSPKKGSSHALDMARAERSSAIVGPAEGSSIAAGYVRAAGGLANRSDYGSQDVVMVVCEAGAGRLRPVAGSRLQGPYRALDAAIEAGASFMLMPAGERAKPNWAGEREVAAHLETRGYAEVGDGLFA